MLNDKKNFINFLKEHNVFSKFIKNFNLQIKWRKTHNHPTDVLTYFRIVDEEYFLSYAFFWRSTKEEDSFWRNLASEWHAKLCLMIKK